METGKRLLFLVGLTRSGTSLLYALLNQHPEIALMYEADAVYLDNDALTPEELGRMEFWNSALSRHGFTRSELAQVRDTRSLFEAFGRHKDATVLGEKSPSYCAHLPRISARFPEARFLIIQRDFAEVYRSVLDAARAVDWWGRPGAFHRLLREQETMQRDVRLLRARGVPIHSVSYRGLVSQTESVMRGVSDFLGVEFSRHLVTLHGADLTAVHPGPEHSHLQRREIGPRANPTVIPARRARCIARFQARWDALEERTQPEALRVAPVGPLEFGYHQALGELVVQFRYLVRRIYEVTPTPALRAYRELKSELRDLPQVMGATRRGVFARRACTEFVTIAAMIGTCAWVNRAAGPEVTMAPFYLLPVAYAVRRLNVAAGLLVSLVTAIVWSSVHLSGETRWEHAGLLAWNSAMRFVVFALFTLLAGAGAEYDAIPAESKRG